MVGMADDSSSSDDEVLKRCKEAVWENQTDKKKGGDSIVQQSKRVVVTDHEHDGNELQVTQGFRTHVAKKLGQLLDSSFTVMKTETLSCAESVKGAAADGEDEDEGFRLFSTSVPGHTADDPPAPVRRQPAPSSSDSDSEMETRLREAAVSVKDLLATSSMTSTLSTPSVQSPCLEIIKKKKKTAEGEESHVVKKKKKRKQTKEESEQLDSVGSPVNQSVSHRDCEHGDSEQENTQVMVKRKKKKKRHIDEEALN